jgi:hypothetical protein
VTPKGILVIGCTDELTDHDRRNSFELFRTNCESGPDTSSNMALSSRTYMQPITPNRNSQARLSMPMTFSFSRLRPNSTGSHYNGQSRTNRRRTRSND